jgi:hypothetical protein
MLRATCSAPLFKLKVLVIFFQLATQVPRVYDVSLPTAVAAFLESVSFCVCPLSLIDTTPLQCIGLAGYRPRLLFWMIVPIVGTLVIVGVVVFLAAWRWCFGYRKTSFALRDDSSAFNLKREPQRQLNILQQTLQPVLVLMFILYPKVSIFGG